MPGFGFGSAKFDLTSINQYLEHQGVSLSQDDEQKLNTIFQDSDVYNDAEKKEGKDGVLNNQEWNNFIKDVENVIPNILNTVKKFRILLVTKEDIITQKTKIEARDATYVAPKKCLETFLQTSTVSTDNKNDTIEKIKTTVKFIIDAEIKKHKTESVNIDVDYWSDKIARISKENNIPPEIIVSIISRETNGKFNKNINCSNGAGPMQITGIAVKSFFPNANGNWNDRYNSLDPKLLDDVLYQKDEDGNFKTDKNGNKILAFSSAKELRNACGKDDELGIKVGTLIFEMKYVESVATELYGGYTYANVQKVINGLKDGTIQLSEAQKEKCLQRAFKNYNNADGIKEAYGKDVIDSLRIHKFDFKEFEIFKG